jgi:hypothetical protein
MGTFSEKISRFKNYMRTMTSYKFNENYKGLKGELHLHLYEKGEMIKEVVQSNIIVNTASILIARLLKDNAEPSSGISYLAVGSGNPSWNLLDPPAPTTSQTKLENEFFRKAIEFSTFVDPESAEPTEVETNIVDYSVTFSEAEAVGPIMELSLFGGDATEETDSGTMVNWRTFPVISKTNTMTLTVIFRITS